MYHGVDCVHSEGLRIGPACKHQTAVTNRRRKVKEARDEGSAILGSAILEEGGKVEERERAREREEDEEESERVGRKEELEDV